MAAPRAYWKGHVRLALVSFPVRLYAAVTQTERVSLHRIHRETHERVRNKTFIEEEGPVEKDDIVMGYEYDRDKYIPVEEAELEALEVESKHTIDLSKFVDLKDIDPIYYEKPYFLAPDGDIATEAFVTIRNALHQAGKVALGKIVLSKRERVVAIKPYGNGLILETLRWPEEVRDAKAYFEDIENVDVSEDQVDMAEMLIKARSGKFEPDSFVDRYQAELRALIERKLKGRPVDHVDPIKQPKSNVINLMDALKASLGGGDGETAPAEKPARAKAMPGKPANDAQPVKASRGAKAKAEPERVDDEPAAEKVPARRSRKSAASAPTAKSKPETDGESEGKPAPNRTRAKKSA